MSLSKLATFPNELLVAIFSCLPLPQRLRLRGVCNRWSSIIEERCLSQETSIVIRQLFIEADGSHRTSHEAKPTDLLVSSDRFKEQLGHLLIRLMPASSSSISLHYDWSTDQSGLARFFAPFANHLVSLSLHHGGYFPRYRLSPDLLASLIACTTLTRLELYRMGLNHLKPLEQILCRLQKLVAIKSSGYTFVEGLAHGCVTANQLTHLAVEDNYILSLSFPETLASKLTHLYLDQCWPPKSRSKMAKFTALRCLTLKLYNYLDQDEEENMEMEVPVCLDGKLLRYFKPMEQLSELTLKNLTYWEGHLKNASLEEQLVSVVKLSLQLDLFIKKVNNWNVSAFLRALASWFPNLKLLTIACSAIHHEAIKAKASAFICPIKLFHHHEMDKYNENM